MIPELHDYADARSSSHKIFSKDFFLKKNIHAKRFLEKLSLKEGKEKISAIVHQL